MLLELARQHVNFLREVVSERTLDYQGRKKCVSRCPPKTTMTTEKSHWLWQKQQLGSGGSGYFLKFQCKIEKEREKREEKYSKGFRKPPTTTTTNVSLAAAARRVEAIKSHEQTKTTVVSHLPLRLGAVL